jgi:hypothetical protein
VTWQKKLVESETASLSPRQQPAHTSSWRAATRAHRHGGFKNPQDMSCIVHASKLATSRAAAAGGRDAGAGSGGGHSWKAGVGLRVVPRPALLSCSHRSIRPVAAALSRRRAPTPLVHPVEITSNRRALGEAARPRVACTATKRERDEQMTRYRTVSSKNLKKNETDDSGGGMAKVLNLDRVRETWVVPWGGWRVFLGYGLADVARHVIDTHFETSFLQFVAS